MKTIKNMWAMGKLLTVLTLLVAVGLLGVLGFIWWMPVNFGYPWYTILGNFFVTAFAAAGAMIIAEIVNGR